jgi:formylglycine-generating enzyme required for sulfatase activity
VEEKTKSLCSDRKFSVFVQALIIYNYIILTTALRSKHMVSAKKFQILSFLFYLVVIAFLFAICCSNSEKISTNFQSKKNNLIQDMVLIPSGEFIMGSDDKEAKEDEKPLHKVYLSTYYIDRYEVTNIQYRKFIIETGHPAPHVDTKWSEPYSWDGLSYPEGKGNYPVVLVSWHDAQAFARWAGKRLPTEAEWEKASRGGLTSQKYPFGNKFNFNHASFDKGYIRGKKIMPVGSYEPNNFGLYDMAGNVWEWCQDWYSKDYYKNSPYRNPTGPSEGFYSVFRGGSWINEKRFLRCSQRGKNVPDYKSYTVSFRCALSADQVVRNNKNKIISARGGGLK